MQSQTTFTPDPTARSPRAAAGVPASAADTGARSRRSARAGRVLTGLPVLLLLFDCVIKFTTLAPVQESFQRLGYRPEVAPVIGGLELICLVAYLVPRTAVLGAILLTGFLGGATATHLRVGDPLFSHILFPGYVGVLIWGGLFLRDARLRALVPVRR